MIKLLIMVLLGFVGYSMLQGLMRPKQPRHKAPRTRSHDGEQMVEDPQCGTFIPLGDAVQAKIDGKQYYFCSRECLNKYREKH